MLGTSDVGPPIRVTYEERFNAGEVDAQLTRWLADGADPVTLLILKGSMTLEQKSGLCERLVALDPAWPAQWLCIADLAQEIGDRAAETQALEQALTLLKTGRNDGTRAARITERLEGIDLE